MITVGQILTAWGTMMGSTKGMEIRRGKWNRMNGGGEQRDQREGDNYNYTEQRDMD